MGNEVVAYAFEPHWFEKLREVEKGLHGDGSVLTGDQRRDLANLLSLVLHNAEQLKRVDVTYRLPTTKR